MSRFFKNPYFVITGALSLVALLFPDLIVLGMFMLVLPGLILGFVANFFLYPLAFRTIYRRLPGLSKRVRQGTAAMAVILPAIAIPWSFNRPTWTRVTALQSDDIAASGPVRLPRAIALLEESSNRSRRSNEAPGCNSLCQRLLYNGAVDTVIVGRPANFRPGQAMTAGPIVSYRIERRDRCDASSALVEDGAWPERDPKRDWRDTAVSRIKARIAAGECLVTASASMDAAEMILVDHAIKQAGADWAHPWALWLDTVSAHRTEVYRRDGSALVPVYRRTLVNAYPLVVPLFIAPVSGGGEYKMRLGFARGSLDRSGFHEAGLRQYPLLFGDAIRSPEGVADQIATPSSGRTGPDPADLRKLVRAALDDPGSAPAGFQVVPDYLTALQRQKRASSDDVDAIARIVRDARKIDFGVLVGTVRTVGEDVVPLAPVFIDALLSANMPAGRDRVQNLSSAIEALPPGSAAAIAGDLRRLADAPILRNAAWGAISRIGDEGPSAVPLYVRLLQTPVNEKRRAHEDGVVIGALVGLCRMGEKAAGAEDALLGLMRARPADRGFDSRAYLAAVTIGRIGRADLLDEFRAHKDWPHIQRRIDRSAKDPQDACRL